MRRARFGRRLLLALLLSGCASGQTTAPNGPGGGSDAGTGPGGGADGAVAAPGVTGVYAVKGHDDRGSYAGEAEVTADAGGLRFTRIVRYDDVTVEDGRELWWVLQGTAQGTPARIQLSATLDPRGFVVKRAGLVRAATDAALTLQGALTASASGELGGMITGPGLQATETWSGRRPSGAAPIFAVDRQVLPAHDPPSASLKAQLFGAFSSFQMLDPVKPYASRPEFQAAAHGHEVDKTDFGFYQAHPNALRVVNKPIDAISLGETILRANAYRYSLATKAEKYQADMAARFMDPEVGMVVDGGPPSGPFAPSGDSALWTGTYVAALAYRYQATGDAKALDALVVSLDAILKLQEITGDWTTFARTLQRATGTPSGLWHAGTGALAHLEWLEGGNNDMIKGLLYAQLMGWQLLCKTPPAGFVDSRNLCSRIKANAQHLANDVKVDRGFNELTTAWLAAVVTGDVSYRIKAEGYWIAGRLELQNNPIQYNQGILDWSGTHLRFAGDTIEVLLAKELDLGGNARQTLKDAIDANHKVVEKQRLAVWHLIHAVHGSGGGAASPFLDDMRWRLREFQYPKWTFEGDHRVSPAYCMSPYPALPWKGDFLDYPTSDRTQALNTFPIFEQAVDTSMWKVGMRYTFPGDYETPGTDFLHAYWYARAHGLLTPTE